MSEERSVLLEVVTPEGKVFDDAVSMVVLPGTQGELGVLHGHEPFVILLAVGETRIHGHDGTERYIASGAGYATIRASKVLMVVDHGELAGAIDVERAERALTRAQEALRERDDMDAQAEIDYRAIEDSLKRAQNRLRVAARVR